MRKAFLALLAIVMAVAASAQITHRPRPAEWKNLVPGGSFKDRFLPMQGNTPSSDTWGATNVISRYTDNGIEDRIWSYWGGNILKGEDGKYHLFVCGWLENSPKGHMEWPNSLVFNAVSDYISGPYTLRNTIGKGHNPEVFRLKDGRYVLYVINGRYVTDNINGRWEYGKFQFNHRDRRLNEDLSNLSFARREDGSYAMVSRGGCMWVSQDGLSPYNLISEKSVYPPVDGRFEDPVLWRDNVQYHLIVNDWLGRIAYYQRSKDGINWVTDPGEVYVPGISVHPDGKVEEWFKYERMKVFQDEYGRATHANFAVIDTLKHQDKPYDKHSSKNIIIPLNKGLLLKVEDTKNITPKTKQISLRLKAEAGFNPQTDVDVASLRFGASAEVNFGRGCKAMATRNDGNDLIVTFDARGHGIIPEEFAGKLIGKYKNGSMLYGYTRLPGVEYIEPILSTRTPVFNTGTKTPTGSIEIQNFGQVASPRATVKIEYTANGKTLKVATATVPPLQPYEATTLSFAGKAGEGICVVTIYAGKKVFSTYTPAAKK